MVDCALMAKNTDKHKRLIELPRFVWDALDKEAERCKRTPLKHLDAILTVYFQLGDVELSDLDSVRAHNNPDSLNKGKSSDYQASIKKKKDNSHLSVASAKTTV